MYRISFPQTDVDDILTEWIDDAEAILEDFRELLPDDLIIITTE